MSTNVAEVLPAALVELIKRLIKRADVQSVSCPFADESLWRALVMEQVERAHRSNLHPQHAFGLAGPDCGLPFDPADWGGYVHIPYEGICDGDLFIKPSWRRWSREAAMGDGDLTAAMMEKKCHHVILHGEQREVDSAERSLFAGWTLYTSKRPYQPCNPFLTQAYNPGERARPPIQIIE